MVDLSIVATTAVSGLPIWILEESRNQKKYESLVLESYTIQDGLLQSSKNNNTKTNDVTLESITPDSNNVSWPIVYMWTAILWFLTSDFLPYEWKNLETLLLITSLKVIVLILFTMPLLVLLVTNTLRIFWIWVRVVFSPFLAIYFVLGDTAPSGMKSLATSLRAEWIGNLLWLLFQPMVVVWTLGIWLVLVTSIVSMMTWWAEYAALASIGDMQLVNTPNPTMVWENVSVTVKWSLFKEVQYRSLWFFWDIILVFFVTFLLRSMVKIGSAFSSVTESVSNSIFWFGKNLAMAIPVVPMMWWQSLWSLSKNAWKLTKAATWVWAFEEKMRADEIKFNKGLRERMWMADPDIQSISSEWLGNLKRIKDWTAKRYWNKYSTLSQEKSNEWLLYKSNVQAAAKQFFTDSPRAWVKRLKNEYSKNMFNGLSEATLTADGYTFENFEKTWQFQNFMKAVSQWKSKEEIIKASNSPWWTSSFLGSNLLK